MIRRSFRFGLLVGLVAGAAVALAKLFGTRPDAVVPADRAPAEPSPWLATEPSPAPRVAPAWTPEPAVQPAATVGWITEPAAPESSLEAPPSAPSPRVAPVTKAPAKPKAPTRTWVEPTGTVCPASHPVKAKLTSKIFHLPGMLNYERTHPDRCYLDATTAEADGLRPAKR